MVIALGVFCSYHERIKRANVRGVRWGLKSQEREGWRSIKTAYESLKNAQRPGLSTREIQLHHLEVLFLASRAAGTRQD
jgi:hypothetical protein